MLCYVTYSRKNETLIEMNYVVLYGFILLLVSRMSDFWFVLIVDFI